MTDRCKQCREPLDTDQDPEIDPYCDGCLAELQGEREMYEDMTQDEDE